MEWCWLISQGDTPVAVYLDEAKAATELAYLRYHGDGYSLRRVLLERAAPRYADLEAA